MKRSGFTLLEVLSVIVIVVSLASILFPVFGTARSAAKRTVCLSNLHQIGLGVQLYQVDHDDGYPPAINDVNRLISVNYGLGSRDPDQYVGYLEVLDPYIDGDGVWQCPMDEGRALPPPRPGKQAPEFARPAFFLFNGGSSYTLATLIDGQTGTSWLCPDRQAFATDAASSWHAPEGASFSRLRVNALFYDGHVATRIRPRGPEFEPSICP